MARGRFALIGGLVALVVVAILAFASIYVVDPTKNAIVLRFGQTVNVTTEPGLYFKVPLVDNVVYIERRLLDLDSPPLEIFAEAQSRLVVDAFARYRVTDPLLFYTANSNANITVANSRLSDILNAAVRRVLGDSSFAEIAQNRSALMAQITQQVNTEGTQLGVEVVDVRIRRADLPAANSQAVFERMRTERQQEAAQIRAEGDEAARIIRATADRNVTVTIALANQQAAVIRGDGDAQANRIFAEAYGLDPDFFAFFRSMEAYRQGLTPATTTLLLSPDSAFFRFFDQFAPIPEEELPNLVLPPVEVPEIEVPEIGPGAVPADPAAPAPAPLTPAPTPEPAPAPAAAPAPEAAAPPAAEVAPAVAAP